MFGLPMTFNVESYKQYRIIMRGYLENEAPLIAAAMSRYNIQEFITLNHSLTEEAELEWIRASATASDSVVWAICVATDDDDIYGTAIGTTSIDSIKHSRGTSGIVIYNEQYWGKGIASACHRARCLYSQDVLELKAIDSDVISGNGASLHVLESVGYVKTGIKYSGWYSAGKWHDCHALTWVSPRENLWDYFWGENTPPVEFEDARIVAQNTLQRAKREVSYV